MAEGDVDEAELAPYRELPKIVVVDVTNSCNLRCPVCPVTIAMTRKRGTMKMPVFRRIVDDFVGRPEKPEIFFNFSGEPTLNRLLPEFIAYAARHGHPTFVSTNATKLTEPMARAMIEAGLGRIYLCLDGFDAEAQESYRVNSDFASVKANIEMFARVRRELGRRNPVCVLQTLLTRHSEGQIADITAWAEATGLDRVRFKSFSTGTHTSPEEKALARRFLPENPAYRRVEDGAAAPPTCHEPTHSTVVFWNGDLGLCCIDYDRKVAMPNVLRDGFVAAHRSDAATRARRDGHLKRHAICRGCAYNSAATMGFKVDLGARRGALPV